MKFIIRLDDITEGTNWKYFELLKDTFDKYGIKPIVGIVPINKDYTIEDKNYLISREDFFAKVRELQDNGYSIAMHGVEHDLVKTHIKSLVDINNYGELVACTYEDKLKYLKNGLNILNQESIFTNIYMPPAHWIDDETVNVLSGIGFKYITDGLFLFPKKIKGIWFVPQQLWKPRRIYLPGIFTICLHINNNTIEEIHNICRFIENNHKSFINFDDIKFDKTIWQNICNLFANYIFRIILKVKKTR